MVSFIKTYLRNLVTRRVCFTFVPPDLSASQKPGYCKVKPIEPITEDIVKLHLGFETGQAVADALEAHFDGGMTFSSLPKCT